LDIVVASVVRSLGGRDLTKARLVAAISSLLRLLLQVDCDVLFCGASEIDATTPTYQ
jgi:hypothetical protein